MDASAPPPPPPTEERASRRRVGALLDAYYGLDGGAGGTAPQLDRQDSMHSFGSTSTAQQHNLAELDKESFDAQRFFDTLVAGASVVDVVRKANSVDGETKDLDGDMQMVCYENYSKFIRATELNNQMRVAMGGLEPDLRVMQNGFRNIFDLQVTVDEAVSERAVQVEALLKQQQLCKKLKVLFTLPTTLSRCLERGAYGQAVKAYCSCAEFLRRHKDIKTFRVVLDDVEHQMGRIQSALEKRLLSAELKVEEALATATTLLLLGEDATKVSKDFLSGRSAALREALNWCFAATEPAKGAQASGVVETAFARATERFIPDISDAVDGFQTAWRDRPVPQQDEVLERFVNARVEDLFDRLALAVAKHCPSTSTLVTCVHTVRDGLRRLAALMPRLLTKLYTSFLGRVAKNAVEALFTKAALAGLDELSRLRQTCLAQQDESSDATDLLEQSTKTEQELMSLCLSSLNDMQPLRELIGEDKTTRKQLARTLRDQLVCFFAAIVEAAWAFTRRETSTDFVLPEEVTSRCQELSAQEWVGTFGLAFMRICQHFEEKGLAKAWTLANDQFSLAEAAPDAVVAKALSGAAERLIGHYVLVVGQKLAHFFRNATEAKKWMSAKEPKEPSLVIEIVFKEVMVCDAEVGRMLADSRKPRSGVRSRSRMYEQTKDSMELEMDRLWAKKMQAYAPVAFNRNAAIAAILRISFKALYEYARENTFNTFGLQQMQVDCALLAELARDCVDGEDINTLEAVLGEVLNSVTQRCVDPVLMEVAAVAALCDEKKRTLRLE